MTRHLLATSLILLLFSAGCSPPAQEPSPSAAPSQAAAGGNPYDLIIVFEGLTTLVPDGFTNPDTLYALLGDYSGPDSLVINEADGIALAAHEPRLYFHAPDGSYTATGWTVKTVDPALHCKPPAWDSETPNRLIALAGDDLTLSANAQPPLKVPPSVGMPEVPNQNVGAGHFGWTPNLEALTSQKIHADLFGANPCTACASLLGARLSTNLGRLQTGSLYRAGSGPRGNPLFARWRFAAAPQWGVHALTHQAVLKMKVLSGPVRFLSKTFDGAASRSLELPAPSDGRSRVVWIVNDPSEDPPDCEGGDADFIGHHNLLADPGSIAKPPYPEEVTDPQIDGQCSPAQGRR